MCAYPCLAEVKDVAVSFLAYLDLLFYLFTLCDLSAKTDHYFQLACGIVNRRHFALVVVGIPIITRYGFFPLYFCLFTHHLVEHFAPRSGQRQWFTRMAAIFFICFTDEPLPQFRLAYGNGVYKQISVRRVEYSDRYRHVIEYLLIKILLRYKGAFYCFISCGICILPKVAPVFPFGKYRQVVPVKNLPCDQVQLIF